MILHQFASQPFTAHADDKHPLADSVKIWN